MRGLISPFRKPSGSVGAWIAITLLWAILLALPSRVIGDEPNSTTSKEVTPEEKAGLLKQRDQFNATAARLAETGKYEEAIEQIEKMLTLERGLFGNENADVDGSLAWLARLCAFVGQNERARQVADELLTLRKRLYPEGASPQADGKNLDALVRRLAELTPENLQLAREAMQHYEQALALRDHNHEAEALPLVEKAAQGLRKQIGDPYRVTSNAWLVLGFLQETLNRLPEAESSLTTAAEMIRTGLGEKHPDLGACEHVFGRVLLAEKKYAAGDEHLQRAIAIRSAALAKAATETQNSVTLRITLLDSWADACEEEQDFVKTRELRTQAMKLSLDQFGEKYWRTAQMRVALAHTVRLEKLTAPQRQRLAQAQADFSLAATKLRDQKPEEGVKLAESALQVRREILTVEDSDTLLSCLQLTEALRDARQFDQARALNAEAIALARKLWGGANVELAYALEQAGGLFNSKPDHAASAAAYREAYTIRRELFGGNQVNTQNVGYSLTGQLRKLIDEKVQQNDYLAAKSLQQEIADHYTGMLGVEHYLTKDALWQLRHLTAVSILTPQERQMLQEADAKYGQAFDEKDKNNFPDALKLFEEVAKVRGEILGEKHLYTAFASDQAGLCLVATKRVAEGIKRLQTGMEIIQAEVGTEHPAYFTVLSFLSQAQQALGNDVAAFDLVAQVVEIRGRVLGKEHKDTLASLDQLLASARRLADPLLAKSDLANSKRVRGELARIAEDVYGAKDPRTVSAQWLGYQIEIVAGLRPDQRRQLAEADRLVTLAQQQIAKSGASHGRYRTDDEQPVVSAQSLAQSASQALQMRKGVLGTSHLLVADGLETLGSAQTLAEEYTKAQASFEEALAIRQKALGAKHPDVLSLRNKIGELLPATLAIPFEPPSKLTPAQRQRLVERDRWDAQSQRQIQQGDFAGAANSAQSMLAIEREVLTDYHPDTARSYELLESLAQRNAQFESQRNYDQWLVAIYTKLYGPGNWKAKEYQVSLETISLMLNWPREKLLQLADAEKQMLKLNQQGVARDEQHREETLRICRQVEAVLTETLGENHLYHANCLDAQGQLLDEAGRWEEAEPLLRRSLQITGAALGTRHPVYHRRVKLLVEHFKATGLRLLDQNQIAAAEKEFNRSLDLLKQQYGHDHWRVIDERATLENHLAFARLPAADQERIRQINSRPYGRPTLYGETLLQEKNLPQFRQDVAEYARIMGADAIPSLERQHDLGATLRACRHFDEALAVLEPVLAARRKLCGSRHPQTAMACLDLGNTYFALGRYSEAERVFTEGQEILDRLGQAGSQVYSTLLNNLAIVYSSLHDDERAEMLLKEVLRYQVEPADANSPNFDGVDLPITTDHHDVLMGEFNIAAVLHRQDTVGAQAPHAPDFAFLAKYVNNLAMRYQTRGKHAEAESLYRQSLWLLRTAEYGMQEETAICLSNLVSVYLSLGKLETAELLADRVAELRKDLGPNDPKRAMSLSNRGAIAFFRRDFARAQQDWQETYQLRRQCLGEENCNTVAALANLGLLAFAQGKHDEAESLLSRVLEQSAANLRLSMNGASERQQLAARSILGGQLDYYLSLARAANVPAEKAYRHVLTWKGAVLVQQRRQREIARLALANDGQPIAKLQKALLNTTTDLANLRFINAIEGEDFAKELESLSRSKDDLERQLAKAVNKPGVSPLATELSVAELIRLLPPKTAIVDYVEYKSVALPPDAKGQIAAEARLAAFVVSQTAVRMIDLGPIAPIEKLIDACREEWTRSKPRTGADPRIPLHAAIWEPIAQDLTGMETVLIAPDGALARFPFAALPGREPDTFLIEDMALATVPAPQLLGELLSAAKQPSNETSSPQLLMVGNVDFGKASPENTKPTSLLATRGGSLSSFAPLPGTATEIEAIQKVYQSQFKNPPTVLAAASATKGALQAQLANARWIHLATHGFFAPAERQSANSERADPLALDQEISSVAGWNPGLLSGIVLAGANQSGGEGGILTAAEVAALDLTQTELVVLSACETGLGRLAGGEGALGIQRAFHAAGVRTVLGSLWKVDDTATQILMTEFYRNHWEKKMSPLAALRAAQLALLNSTLDTSKLRGLTVEEPQTAQRATSARLSPRLWAAFVLSGSP